jgi:hypothetical protein
VQGICESCAVEMGMADDHAIQSHTYYS